VEIGGGLAGGCSGRVVPLLVRRPLLLHRANPGDAELGPAVSVVWESDDESALIRCCVLQPGIGVDHVTASIRG
jgi:hypothetical protein